MKKPLSTLNYEIILDVYFQASPKEDTVAPALIALARGEQDENFLRTTTNSYLRSTMLTPCGHTLTPLQKKNKKLSTLSKFTVKYIE
jgi:hypothetical protein